MKTMTVAEFINAQAKQMADSMGIKDPVVMKFIAAKIPVATAAARNDGGTACLVWQSFLTACKRRDHGAAKGALVRLTALSLRK